MSPDLGKRPEVNGSDGRADAPAPPRLGPAAEHRAASEAAAARRDFDTALRERFRAVLRGLEQNGTLEVRRSRTAQETADDASTTLPLESATPLHPAAGSFDEVVYGGRRATEDEYRHLEYADHYSAAAPPPAPEPAERPEVESPRRRRRRARPEVPRLLRNPRFWGALAAAIAIGFLLYALLQGCGAPTSPPQPPPPELPPPTDYPDDIDFPGFGPGSDSIFSRLPAPPAFGGLQLLIAAAVLVWWRARRRGALVGEPRPVEVRANELLAGQAALYRRSGDHEHLAATLRRATLRRVRPRLGLHPQDGQERVVAVLAARLGAEPAPLYAALYGPVPDAATLDHVATHLDLIEAELG
ncbi:DUF4129 domain-containing protein [Nocardia harenae]|uniref:DUF4129 domain-containing protein n=1 Tax=Nocardia harenae TaxID=358707 RepID=UPI000832372D|nr:DUF4129 domain-containing protein [Nocardia harenae]